LEHSVGLHVLRGAAANCSAKILGSVADREDRVGGAKGVEGCPPSGGAGGRVPAGCLGAMPPEAGVLVHSV